MSISWVRAALASSLAAVTLVAVGVSPAVATPQLTDPLVVSAELLSADGDGCADSAVALEDGFLDIQAQTGGDASLLLAGASGTECVVGVRLRFDAPARLRPAQYLLDGAINTSGTTVPGYHFESSFDGADWYGLRTTLRPGYRGDLYQGGGSRFDPASTCATQLDLTFRVGLSLSSTTVPSAADVIWLEARHGAVAELKTFPCA